MKRYVVYMPDLDYFYYPYYDFFHRENVQVIKFQYPVPQKTENTFLRKLSCHWFSEKNNTRSFHMPFKGIWFPSCKVIPDSTEEIVFVFGELFTLCTPQYRNYLKKHFPNCKIVYTMFDLAKWWLDQTDDMETIKQFADVVFSYDKDDCDIIRIKTKPCNDDSGDTAWYYLQELFDGITKYFEKLEEENGYALTFDNFLNDFGFCTDFGYWNKVSHGIDIKKRTYSKNAANYTGGLGNSSAAYIER